MSKNLQAGRARLTDEELAAVDAILSDGEDDAERRAFREQLRLLRLKRQTQDDDASPS